MVTEAERVIDSNLSHKLMYYMLYLSRPVTDKRIRLYSIYVGILEMSVDVESTNLDIFICNFLHR